MRWPFRKRADTSPERVEHTHPDQAAVMAQALVAGSLYEIDVQSPHGLQVTLPQGVYQLLTVRRGPVVHSDPSDLSDDGAVSV